MIPNIRIRSDLDVCVWRRALSSVAQHIGLINTEQIHNDRREMKRERLVDTLDDTALAYTLKTAGRGSVFRETARGGELVCVLLAPLPRVYCAAGLCAAKTYAEG